MRVSDRTYFTLKRLHSLSGIVPIGLFLIEHLFTNSQAVVGAEAFDRAAGDLARLPYVAAIEALGIWLPILFHMVLGILIATTGQANVGRHGYTRNWMYLMQRVSGLLLVFYILFHTWHTRFNPDYLNSASAYQYMAKQLASPLVFALYALGVVAACYHFGNGLFGFAIHWGLTTGRAAQRRAARVGFAAFVLLTLVGLNALLGFVGRGLYPDWLTKPHARSHVVVLSSAGR